jgi:hypothetical protein
VPSNFFAFPPTVPNANFPFFFLPFFLSFSFVTYILPFPTGFLMGTWLLILLSFLNLSLNLFTHGMNGRFPPTNHPRFPSGSAYGRGGVWGSWLLALTHLLPSAHRCLSFICSSYKTFGLFDETQIKRTECFSMFGDSPPSGVQINHHGGQGPGVEANPTN